MKNIAIVILIVSALFGCAHLKSEVPNIEAYVTLPASGDGFFVETFSDVEGTVPKKEWDEKKKSAVHILPNGWSKLRYTILKNCSTTDCKDFVGVFDELFDRIDAALKSMNKKKR